MLSTGEWRSWPPSCAGIARSRRFPWLHGHPALSARPRAGPTCGLPNPQTTGHRGGKVIVVSTHDAAAARTYAEQAAATASKLKPGTWEAVQALALTSIAHSLAAMADARDSS